MPHTTVGLLVTLILSLFMAPLTAKAQTPAPIPRIGIIGGEPEDSPAWEALRDGLRDLGYVEGQTISMVYRWAEGQVDQLPALAVVGVWPHGHIGIINNLVRTAAQW
jgi:putative ABC transport system substrate-binding protein